MRVVQLKLIFPLQTPKYKSGASILSPQAMLQHLDVIKKASRVVVETDDA